MAHPIRYAVLDHASDDAALWELPLALHQSVDGRMKEVHHRREVQHVMPHLLDLLREGHVEMYQYDEPNGPTLALDDAIAFASDSSNWDPATATVRCGVITTESGDDEYEIERDAARQDR
jgi:hypothetical protein